MTVKLYPPNAIAVAGLCQEHKGPSTYDQAQIFRVNGLQHVAYPGPAAGEYSTSRFWFSSFALGESRCKMAALATNAVERALVSLSKLVLVFEV